MKLPFADKAIIDDAKLVGYCLSLNHPKGKHKAKLFQSLLALTAADASQLRQVLLDVVKSYDAIPSKRNEFGQYYEVHFERSGAKGRMVSMLSVWIVRDGEEFPRLVTVYPL